MARKKEKSAFLSAFGTVFEIVKKIAEAVMALGGNDEDLRRVLTEEGLAQKIAVVIMAGKQKVQETYKVIVDWGKSLAEMIEAGKYSWVNDGINDKHLTLQGLGKQAFDLVLVTVPEILEWLIGQGQATEEQIAKKWVTTKQVFAYFASHGLLAALIEYLLAFGATYPELQRQFPIAALGSSFVLGNGNRHCPCLDCDDDGRKLGLDWDDDDDRWGETCRFLAFRK